MSGHCAGGLERGKMTLNGHALTAGCTCLVFDIMLMSLVG